MLQLGLFHFLFATVKTTTLKEKQAKKNNNIAPLKKDMYFIVRVRFREINTGSDKRKEKQLNEMTSFHWLVSIREAKTIFVKCLKSFSIN